MILSPLWITLKLLGHALGILSLLKVKDRNKVPEFLREGKMNGRRIFPIGELVLRRFELVTFGNDTFSQRNQLLYKG